VKFVARKVVIIFAIAQMEFACAGRPPLQDEDFMVETIEYWSNAADDAFPTRLTVARSGAAELEVMSNEDNPAVPSIGRFSMPTDAPSFEQLAKAVAVPAFAQHANPGPAEPGQVIRRINARFADGHEVRRHVTESAPVDSGFARAEQEALRMAAEIRRHPQHAVAIAMTVAPGATRDQLVLGVTLSNVGAEPLALPQGKYELWGAFIVRLLSEQGGELMIGELVSPRMPIAR